MKKIMSILMIGVVLGLTPGCVTTSTDSQPKTVTEIVESSIPYIEPAVFLITSNILQSAVSDADRVEKANYIYGVSLAVRSLSGGQMPPVAELENTINLWTPDKAHWAKYSTQIAGVYSTYYNKLENKDAKVALKVLEQIALGCEKAAKQYTTVTQ